MKVTSLFGGAISISIPENLIDLSKFREVPDHQEVFADQTELNQSLIIEINELSKEAKDDECARFHFTELSELNEAYKYQVDQVTGLDVEEFKYLKNDSKVYLLKGRQLIEKKKGSEYFQIQFYLAVIRMPHVETDLLITFHQPINEFKVQQVQQFEIMNYNNKELDDLFLNILSSFEIKDWKLF